jgi:hypothetical protein
MQIATWFAMACCLAAGIVSYVHMWQILGDHFAGQLNEPYRCARRMFVSMPRLASALATRCAARTARTTLVRSE